MIINLENKPCLVLSGPFRIIDQEENYVYNIVIIENKKCLICKINESSSFFISIRNYELIELGTRKFLEKYKECDV